MFADLLLRWTATVNLVGRADRGAIDDRHIGDSLRLLPHLPPCSPADGQPAIDLGSGAGFPGLVLAIATGRPFTLIEADARKCAFLAEATRLTAAPATVVNARIEAAAVPPAPLITARALAPLPVLLPLGHRLLRRPGCFLLLKGTSWAAEVDQARADWDFTAETLGPADAAGGVVLRLANLAPAAERGPDTPPT